MTFVQKVCFYEVYRFIKQSIAEKRGLIEITVSFTSLFRLLVLSRH